MQITSVPTDAATTTVEELDDAQTRLSAFVSGTFCGFAMAIVWVGLVWAALVIL